MVYDGTKCDDPRVITNMNTEFQQEDVYDTPLSVIVQHDTVIDHKQLPRDYEISKIYEPWQNKDLRNETAFNEEENYDSIQPKQSESKENNASDQHSQNKEQYDTLQLSTITSTEINKGGYHKMLDHQEKSAIPGLCKVLILVLVGGMISMAYMLYRFDMELTSNKEKASKGYHLLFRFVHSSSS